MACTYHASIARHGRWRGYRFLHCLHWSMFVHFLLHFTHVLTIPFQASGGIGVIGGDKTNFVGLGGCKPEDMLPDLPNFCNSRVLQSPTVWLGIFLGGILTVFLMLYRIKGAILIGIFITSIVSWPRPTAITYFPHTPAGDSSFDFFKKVVTFRPLEKIGGAIDVGVCSCGQIQNVLTVCACSSTTEMVVFGTL